jgi:tetratricopeptide (TPR) repeat protein
MSTALTDRWGVAVQAREAAVVSLFDEAVESLVSLRGDPVGLIGRALQLDPDFPMGRVLQAYLGLYASSAQGRSDAIALIDEVVPADDRERLHIEAVRHWSRGDWRASYLSLEAALLHNPRDLLALKVVQDLYYFLGNRLNLRDGVARVLPAWPTTRPGWGYVHGMYAFGLEENAEYRQAEERARAALAHNPRDVWAAHALAHVFEMEGNQRLGVEFLTGSADDWSPSFFAGHNWWHQALYHLELDELYIGSEPPTQWLAVADGASLLWRLRLLGVDVEDRAAELSEALESLIGEPVYVFNDWHAVMAFGLAGREALVAQVIQANERGAIGTNREAYETAGRSLMAGFAALAAGDPEGAVTELFDVGSYAHVVGGSHAQRDVVGLTLISAAAQARNEPLTQALVAERDARRPTATATTRRLVSV